MPRLYMRTTTVVRPCAPLDWPDAGLHGGVLTEITTRTKETASATAIPPTSQRDYPHLFLGSALLQGDGVR